MSDRTNEAAIRAAMETIAPDLVRELDNVLLLRQAVEAAKPSDDVREIFRDAFGLWGLEITLKASEAQRRYKQIQAN